MVLSAYNINAQNNTNSITGSILDNSSNLPVFYVNVALLNEVDSTIVDVTFSDKEGAFSFSNLKVGDYIIKTSYIGYDTHQEPISVTGVIKLAPILLKPIATELQGITISATKPIYLNTGEKILYNVTEDPSVQTGTVADALQNAPGVEVDIEGNITLRGVPSVEIWINDRPSKLNAENLKTYIQQLPANALERIEVITNPSARYKSSNSGGVINIITKSKNLKNNFLSFGLNGSTKPMASPWLSYMYSGKKFSINLYFNGYYNFSKKKSNGYSVIYNDKMDTSSFRSYTSTVKGQAISTGGWLYASYNIDSLKTISFWGNCWVTPFNINNSFQDYKYQEYVNNPGIYDYTESSSRGRDYHFVRSHFGIDYEHNFNNDGHTLYLSLDGGFWNQYNSNIIKRLYVNYPELNKNKKTSFKNKAYDFTAEANYVLPYRDGDGTIEIGVESCFSTEKYDRRTDTLFTDIYVLDSMRYANYIEKLSELNAYIAVEHTFGNFTIKGGISSDNTFLRYNVFNQPEHHGRKNYPGLFPSLHLSYSTKKMHNFHLSYTRKVEYPEIGQINTFMIYDEDSYSTGNPKLKSQYTNSVEAGWTKYFEKFGSVGLTAYFKNNKNEINEHTDVIFSDFFGRYVSYSMPVNSGKSHRYGGDVNITYKVKAFMSIRLNASLYNYHGETVIRDEKEFTDCFTYSFRVNFWAKVWKFLEINASGNYRSKTKTIFLETLPYYSLNCGLRADFWNKKISVYLNVQDIFNWNKQRSNNTNPYYIAYNSTTSNSRYIGAGITFRFGKIELEKQARTGGNTE